jgi:SAM-dependent methyltransferase
MKKYLEIGLLLTLIVVAAVAVMLITGTGGLSDRLPLGKGEPITIRNVTEEAVQYQISPEDSLPSSEQKLIHKDEIHRYHSRTDLRVLLDYEGVELSYFLKPGKAYSLRYDSFEQIKLYEGTHGREDAVDLAPFVATPHKVVERMLELAEIKSTDIIYDIGCGDGRIVITAAKKYRTRGVGIDIDPQRIAESQAAAQESDVEELVSFQLGDATKMDFSAATIITLYLLPESNEILRPQFEKQLRPGTRIVSHNYRIPGWGSKETHYEDLEDEEGNRHTIYVYLR